MSALIKVLMTAGAAIVAVVLAAGVPAAQQPGMRGMAAGGMQDPDHMKDMQVFHQLIEQRDRITRTVTMTAKGVETLTESGDPNVAALIRSHVAAMTARVEEARPIHMRDPLFRAVFANADRIVMTSTATANGIRVTETSDDPYVVKLIQAHADVVSAFLKNGMEEMRKNHEIPARTR